MRYIVVILLSFALLGGCRRNEVIPDEVLVDIFHDVFLVNAYKSDMLIKVDTGQMYTPIFEKYGYTVDDVGHTIGNFSKRKSARLSDVVELAIKKLEAEQKNYNNEVKILDNIDVVAQREMTRFIYEKDELVMRKKEHADDFKIKLVDIAEGSYKIEFDYEVDEKDKNEGVYRTLIWFEQPVPGEDKDGNPNPPRKVGESNSNLSNKGENSFSRSVISNSLNNNALCLQLIEWRGELKHNPYITIKNLKVSYTPNKARALEEYYEKLLGIKIFSDQFYSEYEEDHSSQLSPTQR